VGERDVIFAVEQDQLRSPDLRSESLRAA
jgi:hypothetical protein